MIFHREITVESDKNNEDTSITVLFVVPLFWYQLLKLR